MAQIQNFLMLSRHTTTWLSNIVAPITKRRKTAGLPLFVFLALAMSPIPSFAGMDTDGGTEMITIDQSGLIPNPIPIPPFQPPVTDQSGPIPVNPPPVPEPKGPVMDGSNSQSLKTMFQDNVAVYVTASNNVNYLLQNGISPDADGMVRFTIGGPTSRVSAGYALLVIPTNALFQKGGELRWDPNILPTIRFWGSISPDFLRNNSTVLYSNGDGGIDLTGLVPALYLQKIIDPLAGVTYTVKKGGMKAGTEGTNFRMFVSDPVVSAEFTINGVVLSVNPGTFVKNEGRDFDVSYYAEMPDGRPVQVTTAAKRERITQFTEAPGRVSVQTMMFDDKGNLVNTFTTVIPCIGCFPEIPPDETNGAR